MEDQTATVKTEETAVDTSKGPDPKVEERARIQGWVPKEEFRGDEARWIPADEFVKRADHMMPILKSVNRKLETQVSDMNRKLAETQGLMKKMVEINTKYGSDLYDTKISDLKTQKRKAAEEGNWELYDRLEIQEGKLSKPEKIEVKPSNENHVDSPHPDVERWMGENRAWFNVDAEMTQYAEFVGEQLKNTKSPLATPGHEYEFCKEVERRVKTAYKDKFVNPNRSRSEVDESGLRGGENLDIGKKKSWNDLPQDAKLHCNKLISEIKGYSKEKYLKDYFSEGA